MFHLPSILCSLGVNVRLISEELTLMSSFSLLFTLPRSRITSRRISSGLVHIYGASAAISWWIEKMSDILIYKVGFVLAYRSLYSLISKKVSASWTVITMNRVRNWEAEALKESCTYCFPIYLQVSVLIH